MITTKAVLAAALAVAVGLWLATAPPQLANVPVVSPPPPGATPAPTPAPTPQPAPGGDATFTGRTRPLVAGVATWYRWRVGEAAAGPALRRALGKNWRGQYVRVTYWNRSVDVRLTDWCACGGGRVVDLDSRAFRALAPLSVGVLRVQVELLEVVPEPPDTSTAP